MTQILDASELSPAFQTLTSFHLLSPDKMAALNQKVYAQLAALIEENGISAILGGISSITSGNPGTFAETGKSAKTGKKKASPNSKKGLLELIQGKFPDWNLGKGKGISIASLKEALESGDKPEPKKRVNPYFTFLALVRKELSEKDLSQKQIIRIGSRRWQILKTFASENNHSPKDVVQSEELIAEVAKLYASIEEDLEGMVAAAPKAKKAKKVKSTKKAKKTKKVEPTEHDVVAEASPSTEELPVSDMFDMSDSDDDDE